MGLWAGGLGDWARGGRGGDVTLPTIGGSGLGCRVGSSWAMVSAVFGASGALIRFYLAWGTRELARGVCILRP